MCMRRSSRVRASRFSPRSSSRSSSDRTDGWRNEMRRRSSCHGIRPGRRCLSSAQREHSRSNGRKRSMRWPRRMRIRCNTSRVTAGVERKDTRAICTVTSGGDPPTDRSSNGTVTAGYVRSVRTLPAMPCCGTSGEARWRRSEPISKPSTRREVQRHQRRRCQVIERHGWAVRPLRDPAVKLSALVSVEDGGGVNGIARAPRAERTSVQLQSTNAQIPCKTGEHQRPESKTIQQVTEPCEICKTSIPGSNPGGASNYKPS